MSIQSGTLIGLPFTAVNRAVADGVGSLTGSGTAVLNGVVSFPVIDATYTINPDCTGTVTSTSGLTQNIIIRKDGDQVFFVVTAHPAGAATISGEVVRVSQKSD